MCPGQWVPKAYSRAMGDADDPGTAPERANRAVGPRPGSAGLKSRVLSVFFVFFLVAIITMSAPNSPERDSVLTQVGPLIDVTHLNQSWSVFAPNPPDRSVALHAEATMTDGRILEHRFPRPDAFVGNWRAYRFRKFGENLVVFPQFYDSWAQRVARELADETGVEAAKVEIVLVQQGVPEPGSTFEPVAVTQVLHTLVVGEAE